MTAPFRYRKLGYVALTVSDLARSVAFYRDIVGLDLAEQTDGSAFFRCGQDHHSLVLYQGASAGLRRVAFEVEDANHLALAFEHFHELGLKPQPLHKGEAQALHQGSGFRVREPHSGLVFEIYSAVMQMARPWRPTVAKIERLGHVVIGSKHFDDTLRTLTEAFNFVVSDYVEDRFSFLRCFPNPFHHTFAVGASPDNCLHHINFMVSDIDDVGRALHRMRSHDVKVAFGPGRHPPSGSVFFYFFDPDGITVEYSFGMEEFPEQGAREPRMLEPVPGSLDTWGAIPDPQFGKGPHIEVTA